MGGTHRVATPMERRDRSVVVTELHLNRAQRQQRVENALVLGPQRRFHDRKPLVNLGQTSLVVPRRGEQQAKPGPHAARVGVRVALRVLSNRQGASLVVESLVETSEETK